MIFLGYSKQYLRENNACFIMLILCFATAYKIIKYNTLLVLCSLVYNFSMNKKLLSTKVFNNKYVLKIDFFRLIAF